MLDFPSYCDFANLLCLFLRINAINFKIDKCHLQEYAEFVKNKMNETNKIEIKWLQYCHKLHPVKYIDDIYKGICSVDLIESSEKQKNVVFSFFSKNYTFSQIYNIYISGITEYVKFFSNLDRNNYNYPEKIEIDLLWHTHMNNHQQYQKMCILFHKKL